MDMKQVLKWTVTLIAIIAFQHANAINQTNDSIIPVKFDISGTVADHLAYLTLMKNLRQTERRNGHESNIANIRNHLSLDREHAELFLQFILTSYNEMIDTNRALANRLLCAGDKPRYDDAQAYQVLDVIDDIKETNLRKIYQRAMINFGSHTAGELSTWLVAIKIASPRDEDSNAVLHTDESVEQMVGSACNVVAAF